MPISQNVDWYRDILRAKLVSLRIPKRLLLTYKEKLLEEIRRLEEVFSHQPGTDVDQSRST